MLRHWQTEAAQHVRSDSLELARHWLTAGDQPIERIAERLGYRQPSNFIRARTQAIRDYAQAVSVGVVGEGNAYGSRSGRPVGRLALALALAFDLDLLAPSRGRAQVLRSGQPGMDAGLAAPGHGWPMAAGPRSRTGARACRALARHRTKGAGALGYLGLFQVTRRKGETNSGRNRRNGYVHRQQNPGRLSGRHRWQASSYSESGAAASELVGCQAVIAGKPAPTVDRVQPRVIGWVSGRHRRQASSHSRSGTR